jgi:hypothetical protein
MQTHIFFFVILIEIFIVKNNVSRIYTKKKLKNATIVYA